MARLEDIALILYEGFMPYVAKNKREEYADLFVSRKRYTSKFLLEFFPKFVNETKGLRKPKETRDIYLFNYYFIEVPVMGFKKSQIFYRYYYDRHLRTKKGIRKLKT